MQVLVTGCRGLLGVELMDVLASRGHEAIGLSHADYDVADPEHAARLGAGEFGRPQWIVNCAAYTAVDRAETEEQLATEINGFGPAYLLRAADDLQASLVHISTDFVFDGSSSEPYREEDPVNPLGAYGRSKLVGERALEANPRAFVVRTSWLFGPRGNSFPKTILNAYRQGKKLRVVADQIGTPTYTPHLATALAEILERNPFPGIYHAAGPERMSWHEFATRVISKCTGEDPAIEAIATSDWPTPAKRPAFSALDPSKLIRAGISPLPALDEAMSDFCARLSS